MSRRTKTRVSFSILLLAVAAALTSFLTLVETVFATSLIPRRRPLSASFSVTVLSASARDQISYAYDKKGHGLFTYFFLKGLGAEADGGEVDMHDVFKYAAKKVSRIARRTYNSEQTPQLRTSRR